MLWGSLIIFCSAVLQSLSGFGFSLLAAPLITLLVFPRIAVPVLVIFSIFINLGVICFNHAHIELKSMRILIAGGVMALPLGARVLVILPGDILKIIIGVIISVFALYFIMGRMNGKSGVKWILFPIGLISGTLSSSISMGGPPVIIYLTSRNVKMGFFKGNLAVYFLILNLIAIPIYIMNRLVTREVLDLSLYLFPALLLGIGVGNYASRYLPERYFRRVTVVLMLGMGILAIISGLGFW
ncbi:MAG: sulfite exporter TauE/SafE family protein [Candidatus Cloacimonetes bacterium]|nr:sulfite exporter TauE/SafE family protein [Candidatus Cloacimonadota bacterium]